MRRRDLISVAGLGGVIGAAGGFWAGKRRQAAAVRAGWMPAALQSSGTQPKTDPSAYFTEDTMLRELGTARLTAPSGCTVVAYNFPSWHPSPFMEKIFGKKWTEFETLKKSKPLYPGHLFPKYPLWGYFNEADPAWAEKEVQAAVDHGIGVWMIDWYWHSGTMFYQEQLEDGFLKARNFSKLKFAVMWANHDWKNVYPARSPNDAALLLAQTHSEQDCLKVIDYCVDRYFHQPNYWRLDGAPVFGIFDMGKLAEGLGGADGMKRAFDGMRRRVQKVGLGELHIQANQSYGGYETKFKELGVNSATSYHTFGWTFGGRPPGGLSPYCDGAVATIRAWKKNTARCNVPYFPDCPVGWDDSPRFGRSAHMVTQRSADQYELLLRAARHSVSDHQSKIVFLSSWNEWTEDHVLLPDTTHGFSYLAAVRHAFQS
jgi:hypothetical protein